MLAAAYFECKNRFYIKKPMETVFACFSRYFHPDPSTPSQCPTLHLSLGRSQVFGAPDSRRRRSRCCHRCPENEALWGLALFLGNVLVFFHTHTFKRFNKRRRRPQPPISDEIAKVMLLPTTKIQNHSQLERVVIAISDS